MRVWITKGGVKFTRYNARAQKVMERKADGKMSTLDEYASQLMPGSYLGKPEVMERLTECGVDIGRQFPKVPTVQQYLANRESAGSVYVVSETKISNLHDDDRLYIDNRCIDDLPEAEINDIFRMFDLEGYVRMIGEFAKSWHNVIVA